MRLLVFGSSHRHGGSGGWTDAARVSHLFMIARPSRVGHGASPSKGADEIAGIEADRLGIPVDEFPMDEALDGSHGGRFMNRNTRQLATFRPHLAAGGIVGKVGQKVGSRGCYLSNGSQDMADKVRAAKVPLVIYREDGIEPLFVGGLVPTLQACRDALAALYPLRRAEVRPAGEAMAAALRERGAGDSVLAASSALEVLGEVAPDLAPWVGAVQVTLRPWVRG